MIIVRYSLLGVLLLSVSNFAFATSDDDDAGFPSASSYSSSLSSAPLVRAKDDAGASDASDWRAPFYKSAGASSEPRVDIIQVTNAAIGKRITQTQLHELLKEESDKGNPVAQEKLFFFLTENFLHIDLVSFKAAFSLLEKILREPPPPAWLFSDSMNERLEKGVQNGEKWACAYSALLEGSCFNKAGNKVKALERYRTAARLGSSIAQVAVGNLLSEGFDGQKSDKSEALVYFEKAANSGDFILAKMSAASLLLEDFDGREPDIPGAFNYYKQAADLGDRAAKFYVGALLSEGFDGQAPDKPQALVYLKQAADLGNIDAKFHVGALLYIGFDGQAPDKPQALAYLKQAADLGHRAAKFYVGALLSEGFDGQAPDKPQAIVYLKQAVDLGHSEAIHLVGVILRSIGKKDEAYHYFIRAADKGNTSSMVELGKRYLGVYEAADAHIPMALFWLEKAAALGDTNASEYLRIAKDSEGKEKPEEEEEADEAQDDDLLNLLKKTEEIPEIPEIKTSALEIAQEPPLKTPALESVPEREKVPSDDDDETLSDEEEFDFEITPEEMEKAAPPQIRNPKYVREQLRRVHKEKLKRDAELLSPEQRVLDSKAQTVAHNILGKSSAEVNRNDLQTLFGDPFFQRQVVCEPTKSGVMIIAHNPGTDQHASASTHRKHTKSSKGDFAPAFVSELQGVLAIFGIE